MRRRFVGGCVGIFIYKREGSENMQRQETERGMYEGIHDRKLKEHFEAPYDTFEIIMVMVNLE